MVVGGEGRPPLKFRFDRSRGLPTRASRVFLPLGWNILISFSSTCYYSLHSLRESEREKKREREKERGRKTFSIISIISWRQFHNHQSVNDDEEFFGPNSLRCFRFAVCFIQRYLYRVSHSLPPLSALVRRSPRRGCLCSRPM